MTDVRAPLFARLDALGVAHKTVEHPAFYTVEEGRAFKADMPGAHSKTLFLKDKKGALVMAVSHADTRADLNALGKRIGAKGRLSFCAPELMDEVLGVAPGSVTPFALLNDREGRVSTVVVDAALVGDARCWFHPMENTASTAISPDGLFVFLRAEGPEPVVLDLSAPLEGA